MCWAGLVLWINPCSTLQDPLGSSPVPVLHPAMKVWWALEDPGVQLGCEEAGGALMSPGCPQQSRVLGRVLGKVLERCSSSGHSRGKAAFLSANQGLQTRTEEGWLCPGSGCFGNNAYL